MHKLVYPACKEFPGLLLNHCITASCKFLSDLNVRPLSAFFNDPKSWKSHGSKSVLYARQMRTAHLKTLSVPWNVRVTCGQALSCSRMLPSVRLPDVYSWYADLKPFTVLSAYKFQEVHILPLQETASLPPGPVWTDSPASAPSFICPAQPPAALLAQWTVLPRSSVCRRVYRVKCADARSTLPQQCCERVAVEHALYC